jgi:hypothetical protein
LKRWLDADFSWPGLAMHPSWLRGGGGTVQDNLRRFQRNASDDDLIAQGTLLNCGSHGLYHVLFIPQEWSASGTVEISADELLRRKQQHWENLISEQIIRETARGTISGVHMPPDIEQRLVAGFRVSFEWVRFSLPLRNIPRRGDRSFTWCAFTEQVIFYGAANTEGGESTVHFTWCEFLKPIIAQQVTALDLLDINGCLVFGKIEVSDSNLSKFRFDDSTAKSLSMTDTNVTGPITLGTSTFDWIEWINCTFDGHVLFVDSAIEKSIGWLACDFKSRVTLASVTWPSKSYGCASASGSKFDGIVEISGGDPPPVQLFQEAEFRSKVSLNSFSDRAKRESFRKELTAADSQTDASFNRQQHAQDVESGCRTLRKVAEAAGDVHSEQLWHRAELIARRTRGGALHQKRAFHSSMGCWPTMACQSLGLLLLWLSQHGFSHFCLLGSAAQIGLEH